MDQLAPASPTVYKNYVDAFETWKAGDNIEKWTTKHDYNWYLIRRGASPSKQEKIV